MDKQEAVRILGIDVAPFWLVPNTAVQASGVTGVTHPCITGLLTPASSPCSPLHQRAASARASRCSAHAVPGLPSVTRILQSRVTRILHQELREFCSRLESDPENFLTARGPAPLTPAMPYVCCCRARHRGLPRAWLGLIWVFVIRSEGLARQLA